MNGLGGEVPVIGFNAGQAGAGTRHGEVFVLLDGRDRRRAVPRFGMLGGSGFNLAPGDGVPGLRPPRRDLDAAAEQVAARCRCAT